MQLESKCGEDPSPSPADPHSRGKFAPRAALAQVFALPAAARSHAHACRERQLFGAATAPGHRSLLYGARIPGNYF